MVEANILTLVKGKNGNAVGEHKPTEEELICIKCPKYDCKKGDCKRFREQAREIRNKSKRN